MRRVPRLGALVLTTCLLVPSSAARAQNVPTEEAAVRAALQHYIQGHATGDGAHMDMAFHPEAKLFFTTNGQLTIRTSAEYISGFKRGAEARPRADEAQWKRWIESVDVVGDAAVAKIILDGPTVRLTDYMSLLKLNGAWKIINKSFTRTPK